MTFPPAPRLRRPWRLHWELLAVHGLNIAGWVLIALLIKGVLGQ